MPCPQINSLYETHLFVESLERSIAFYQGVLGLRLAHIEEERRAAFFWIGEGKQTMVGVWERPKTEIEIRHFAFRVEPAAVLDSVAWLQEAGLQPHNFFSKDDAEPMVFAWVPAVAIYFRDPDGHSLEFIGLLDSEPAPERGVVRYSEWSTGK